jgi:hypothetical protein
MIERLGGLIISEYPAIGLFVTTLLCAHHACLYMGSSVQEVVENFAVGILACA